MADLRKRSETRMHGIARRCRSRRSAWRGLSAALALVAVACVEAQVSPPVNTPVSPQAKEPTAETLVWPKPPAAARIRYVKSIATPADWGIAPGLFARLVDAVAGDARVRFVRPTGVVERAGVLYVADPGAQALFILDARQGKTVQVTQAGEERLLSPVGVALGPADTVFVVDSVRKSVYALDRDGKLQGRFTHESLVRPAAAAYDPAADRLYVADSAGHHIVVFSARGRFVQTLGRNGRDDGEFNFPTHLALTRDGNLLVTDALNFRVQAFDPSGRFLWKLGRVGDGSGDFASPKGVAADSAGQVYVVDALFDAVQVFRPDGSLLLAFGDRGTRAGHFWLPGGIFIDRDDVLYVADSYNQRIQVFRREPVTGDAAAK